MKLWQLGLSGALLAAGVAAGATLLFGAKTQTTTSAAKLKDYGPAPELSNQVWLNVETPLRLADLHGKVTLIDMWTFG